MRWPLARGTRGLAEAWWAQPEPRHEATPGDAATVVLVRDSCSGLEVFVLRRHQTMSFAPGMVVFPGGGVDPGDACIEHAAIRELFEESGVLLASEAAGAFPDTNTRDWEERRRAVERRSRTLGSVLAETSLTTRTDLLMPWSRWVTPRFQPRRYDTWFFVACLPPGQQARHVVGEAVESAWVRPSELLASSAEWLMQPTQETLLDLASLDCWGELVAAARAGPGSSGRSMQPQLAELVLVDGEFYLEHELADPRPVGGSGVSRVESAP